ncbi:MAG TPA: S8 family serine peptidase [Candidatus Limnocylindria bacterium]|nr:S8 family serine peptidase [Candidatus Limnocylindria bacterium]
MTRTRPIILSLFLLAASATPISAAPGASAPASGQPEAAAKDKAGHTDLGHAPDRVIVQWKDPDKGAVNEKARGLSLLSTLHGDKGPSVLRTNGASVEATVKQLSKDPAVAWAEPDYVMQVEAAVAVNDPLSSRQYSLDRMRVRDAWSLTKGGTALIGVVDTGVQFNHPDLAGRLVAGYDFVNGDSNATDDNGHGTWVSGILAGNPNNGVGVAGITWTNKVLPVKVMDATGHGYSSNVAKGIDYAVSRGAKIINMSIGGFEFSYAVRDAVNRAWASGTVLVAAAGNYRTSQPSYPAAYDHVISVSATQADDEFTNWSNYGGTVDVSAPGAAVTTANCTVSPCIHSTWGGYIDISGTSFSTPNTAGVVALIMARYPSYTNQQVVDRLLSTTDDLGFRGWDDRYGRGRVNAYRAVGGSPAAIAPQTGDGAEPNDGAPTASPLGFGTARPNNYPAGDADFFSFSAPRAGRIDVAVTPIIDTSRPAKSSLSFDPMLELWVDGTLVKKVDDPSSSATIERVSYQASGPKKIVIGIRNWLPNGVKPAYTLTSAFVDNVKPVVASRAPAGGATNLPADVVATAVFSEAVSGVSATSFSLTDATGRVVPATVGYDSSARRAWLRPSSPLAGEQTYTVSASSGIRDVAGNAMNATSWTLSTGKVEYRVAGADRYATAAAVSRATFATGVPVAVLASGEAFPDALAGGPFAVKNGAPVLLVTASTIPAATADELTRLKPGRIVILGGTGRVSGAVATVAAGYTTGTVTRLAGVDRYATAARISAETFATGAPVAYVATGERFADALAGGAVAGRDGGPVLLVTGSKIPAATATELSRLKPGRIVILGGTGSVGSTVAAQLAAYTTGGVTRFGGADRYATAVALSAGSYLAGGPDTVYLSTGSAFPDSLAAGSPAGDGGDPVLLVRPDALPDAVADEIRRIDPSQVVVVGGTGSVSDAVRAAIRNLLD